MERAGVAEKRYTSILAVPGSNQSESLQGNVGLTNQSTPWSEAFVRSQQFLN